MLETVLDKSWGDFTDQTINRAKWIILDTAISSWDGVQSEELVNYIGLVGKQDRDDYHTIPIIGTNSYTSAQDSLIIHGTAVVSNEMDEGNQFAKGHPAAHIFAPAYVAAIEQRATGQEFIRAFILGYEVAARFAYACNMNDDMHPHGTWGTIGGTVAAALLQKKSKAEIIDSALLAATLPLATSWEAAVTGKTVRNLYTGLSAQIAYQILSFQSSGFISSPHVVEHLWGNIISNRLDANLFEKKLWEPPLIDKSFFKYYPSCRFSHSAIDALYKMVGKHKFQSTEIDKVKVETYGLAARLKEPRPQNKLVAKFSIPYLLACILLERNLYDSFGEFAFSDDEILTLSEKMIVVENNEMTKALPEERAAKLTITLKNGYEYIEEVRDASGSFKEPLSEKELTKKYIGILRNKQLVARLINITMILDQSKDMNDWVKELREKEQSLV